MKNSKYCCCSCCCWLAAQRTGRRRWMWRCVLLLLLLLGGSVCFLLALSPTLILTVCPPVFLVGGCFILSALPIFTTCFPLL
jgi:hypothetical protein